MIYIYRIVYYFLSVFLLSLEFVLPEPVKKLITLRKYKIVRNPELENCIWFHAASGEIEYCKSIIREIKRIHPQAKIVVSYSSPSAERLFKNIQDEVSLFFPLPWDRPKEISELYEILKPQILVFSRTDFWPELIYQAELVNLKLVVISYNQNPNSGFLQNLIRISLLKKFSLISCADEASALILKSNLPKITVCCDGDTRFDQVFYRLEQKPRFNIVSDKKVMVLGSTWSEDEEVILNSLSLLKSNMKFVLSPHEVAEQNISSLARRLDTLNISYVRLSELLNKAENNSPENLIQIVLEKNVLLVDRIGFLADCYRFADLAFVGGSFKSRVHSVMEPLCCGLHVLVGSHISNSPEALRYLNRFVHIVKNSDDFSKQADEFLLSKDKSIILAEMNLNKNATAAATKRILELIKL